MAAAASRTVALAIGGPIAPDDLPRLCAGVSALLTHSGADVALFDLSGVAPDAVMIDALARLQLTAQRHGCEIRLRHAPSELRELVAFMGLSDVLPG